MARYRAAIIGTGRPRELGGTGAAMSRFHAQGYQLSGKADIVALADIRPENAEAFRAEQNCPDAKIYTDYRDLLEREHLDVVSVVTWPHLHAEMVIACAEAGVRAVHSEKPMAPTWGEARHMHETCERLGTQLTFNHQRRFEAKFRTARRLLLAGAVGEVIQMQAACPNLFDWGTHWFDMLNFYNGDVPAAWVMGQIDARSERTAFGVRMENQGVSYIAYENGVRGLLLTGDYLPDPATGAGAAAAAGQPRRGPSNRRSAVRVAQRVIGTEGILEVEAPESKVRLLNGDTAGYREVPLDDFPTNGAQVIAAGIANALECLETGARPELSSHNALRATELIFATYESARRRARIDLPLQIEDNPLHAMMDTGALTPAPREG
jgi:predicted dehydrogenase